MKDVPGVVVTGGGSSQDISIRGMGAKYTLILVDGKRQGSRETRPRGDGPGIEQGWLPPLSAIERIEVIRGPMSSLYGSDALGGVINVITRKVAKEWGGSVTADTTIQEDSDSGDINQTRFYVGGPLKDDVLGLQVYGQYSQRNEDEIESGYNEHNVRSGTAKLSWIPTDSQTFEFEAGVNKQQRISNPGKSVAAIGSRGPNTRSESEYIRRHYAVTHQGRWDFGTTDSYVQREEVDKLTGDMTYESTVFNTQTVMPLGANILTLGGQYENQKLTDGETGGGAGGKDELKRWQWALFAEDEWMLTEDFSLTGGARLNKDENYGTHWSPRLYGVWNLAPEWTVKGGVTSGYRTPDLRQSTEGWILESRGGTQHGNPDLKPEKSLNHELGVIWDNRQGTQAGLTVFQTDFKDKIQETNYYGPDCVVADCMHNGRQERTHENVDKATIQGVEAILTLPLATDYSLSANYTYTDSEQKSGPDKGEPLNDMPRHRANATLNWQPEGPLSAWTRVNYRGRSSGAPAFHGNSGEKIPSYTFVDAGTAYQLTKSTTLFGGVYNLLDKEIDQEDYDKTLDGRRYNLGITVEF